MRKINKAMERDWGINETCNSLRLSLFLSIVTGRVSQGLEEQSRESFEVSKILRTSFWTKIKQDIRYCKLE